MIAKTPYTLIDTAGQTTAVIDVPIPRRRQPLVAKPLMKSVKNIGQVCFIEDGKNCPRLQMMGNEFSVNGTIAGAFYLLRKLNKKEIYLVTSGLKSLVKAVIAKNKISALFPKKLTGIKFVLEPGLRTPKTTRQQKSILKSLAQDCPATGIVYYQGNKIQPLIYVKATNTFVWETCCGSASVTFAQLTNQSRIIQPSGKAVTVRAGPKNIAYSLKVTVLS